MLTTSEVGRQDDEGYTCVRWWTGYTQTHSAPPTRSYAKWNMNVKTTTAQSQALKLEITLHDSTPQLPDLLHLTLTPAGFVRQTESVTHGDIKGMRCEESCLINQRLRWARSTQPVCSLMWFQSTVASLLSVLGACAHTGLFPPVFRTICIST